MKKFMAFLKTHKKSVFIGCFLLIIGVSAYTDYRLHLDKDLEVSNDYLYTRSQDSQNVKILGEAKLVDGVSQVAQDEEDAYFTSAQTDKERSRDQALETLQVVIDSAESMPDAKDEALNHMIDIASNIEKETLVEEMIKAKGFADCLAVINEESIHVVVKSPGLLTNEVAQITDIVMEETGFSPENIKIVEKN